MRLRKLRQQLSRRRKMFKNRRKNKVSQMNKPSQSYPKTKSYGRRRWVKLWLNSKVKWITLRISIEVT